MNLRACALWLCVFVAGVFAACTNGGGLGTIGGGGNTPSPQPSSSGIGIAIPSRKIGVVNDPVWGTVSGYTQNQTSQVLAFAPGAKITLKNLSSIDPHTLNVISATKGPPPNWPASPSLSFYASGNGVLGPGYASGILQPGATVTVTLSKPGIYLIGCAFHYVEFAMRDIVEVVAGATPGPTASPGPGGYAIPLPRKPKAAAVSTEPHLVDQRGRSFTIDSLRGKPLVVTFISAHCTDACPLIDAQFGDAARRIAQAHLAARLLTITLDPEHDSLHDMRVLATRFEANPHYWLLAGGSIANVHAVMHAFGVLSVQGRSGYRDEHTTFVYVMKRNGVLAQTMMASSALSDTILDAVRGALRVAQR